MSAKRRDRHTPGPWKLRYLTAAGAEGFSVLRSLTSELVCTLPSRHGYANADQGEHDARLIAAAPDLLAACERALLFAENHAIMARGSDEDTADTLRAAIQKATQRGIE